MADEKRISRVEAQLASHDAKFEERQRAEVQAQTERQLAAAAVQQALQEAAAASGKALEAALKNANELELERVARVQAQVTAVSSSLTAALEDLQRAQGKFEEGVRERFTTVNEFRGSLDDLGKSMGTRRELEQAQEAFRSAHDALQREVNQLRSRVDVGPDGLRGLQERSDQDIGAQREGKVREQREERAERRDQQVATLRMMAAAIFASLIGGSVFLAVLHSIHAIG
jgi:DNA repair exonuclease SbcCD ATPase subunit